eukprot:Protomagalhaensia_sp_Gyna_25__263@NODE_1124_length_2164_cov_20_418824_g892_i0_p1_GENE_NODE_1124_length_2164_cov_20_418824_g892_i0NODE_1124_length_2164_cov_20_418824_g892_i0_p1_ORF_typecomplete_len346_score18_89Methyltransf_11/PF08241_12/8e12Methyltransf_11/PF08241_12/1_3e03Methyltransf_25/PF13649_6/1_2e04Methyltransf_25/PF13649_6/1_2e09Methyltransf_25/PF13649_6/8_7e03Methyltransf_31/PF13847_6/8_9e10Methyltransf_23/PF13489_6/7_7e06Ubie_methyltran/PF01209_18/7e06Ubie_methyltran/PF01209_18/4_3e03CM
MSVLRRHARKRGNEIDVGSPLSFYNAKEAQTYTSGPARRIQSDLKSYLAQLRRLLSDQPGILGIDAGCGSGLSIPEEPNAIFIGVDISMEMLSLARRTSRQLELVACDLKQQLPFRDGVVDMFNSVSALQWLAEQDNLMTLRKEIARVLSSHNTIVSQFYTMSEGSTRALSVALSGSRGACEAFFGFPHKCNAQKLFKCCNNQALCSNNNGVRPFCVLSRRPLMPCALQILEQHGCLHHTNQLVQAELAGHWTFVIDEYRRRKWAENEKTAAPVKPHQTVRMRTAHEGAKLEHLWIRCSALLLPVENNSVSFSSHRTRAQIRLMLRKLLRTEEMMGLCHGTWYQT